MSFEVIRKFYVQKQMRHGMPYDAFQAWCRENLSDKAEATEMFDHWVVNTTDDEDLVFLSLKYGQPERLDGNED